MDGRGSQRAQETSRSIPTVPGREANLSAVQKAVGKPATDRERKEQALSSAEWPPCAQACPTPDHVHRLAVVARPVCVPAKGGVVLAVQADRQRHPDAIVTGRDPELEIPVLGARQGFIEGADFEQDAFSSHDGIECHALPKQRGENVAARKRLGRRGRIYRREVGVAQHALGIYESDVWSGQQDFQVRTEVSVQPYIVIIEEGDELSA